MLDAAAVTLRGNDGLALAQGSAAGTAVRCTLPLGDARAPLAHLELTWNDGREEVDRDHEIALEMVLPALTTTVRRLPAVGSERSGRVIPLR